MKILQLIGAYGRVYDSGDDALRDWEAGKDFKILDGPYCSTAELSTIKADGYTNLEFISMPVGWTLLWLKLK